MNQITPRRLGKLIDAAFAKTKNSREGRVKMISQYVGRFGRKTRSDGDEASKASPLNLLHSAVSVLVPNLVFNNPKAEVSTDILAYRDYADRLAKGITTVAKRIEFRDTLRAAITDAIFMAGFIKTGLAVGDCVVEFGDDVNVNVTEPFAERVSPDDMILDPMARAWGEQAFLGNRFRADVDHLIEIGYGDADLLDKLASDAQLIATRDRAESISGSNSSSEEPRRYLELAEIWIPHEKRIVTLPYKPGATFDDLVHSIDYGGPAKGQYHMLGYAYVPDNLLPVAPAGIWYDLHILGNRIARKIARQAERNKKVLAYEDEAEEDVEAIADANDGVTVRVANLDKMKEFEFGAASEHGYEWMNWIKQNFSEQAGSLDQLSGSGTDEPTLGQSQMVQANTTVRLGDMQNLVYGFAGKAFSDIGFFLHTDPMIDLPLVRRINGVETQDYYTPDSRVGEWYDYNLDVEPYSMARTDPNTQVRRMMEFATSVIPAAAQAQVALGPGFNIGAFLSRIAKKTGVEDVEEWLNTPQVQQWIQEQMIMSQKTGDPGKAAGGGTTQPPMLSAMGQPPLNPNQPNPGQMGPSGGISVGTEQAQAAQEASNPNQASVKALALNRGGL